MGRDKARLPVDSHLLVQDVVRKVNCVAESVALVGEALRYRDLGLECFDDLRHPSQGPLAGIETALATGRGELNLIVACDMPDLEVEWLRQLVGVALEQGSDCLICQDASGVIHPLCGVWSRNSLPFVQRALDAGRLRVLELTRELNAGVLPIAGRMFNINTPEDWNAWEMRERL